ncbi:hypothetical protein [Streptomyces sp. 039-1]|uniref:hypothetical protein n=1 Tax=Streptomyces sp. 039-1 TaxID=2789263 RepID=UPI0039F5CB18
MANEALRALVQFVVVHAVVLSGQDDGVHGAAESRTDCRFRYRVPVGEQEEGEIGGPFAPAGTAGEREDELEAHGRRGGRAAPAAAEAAAGHIAWKQAGSPPDFELLGRDGDVVARRVVDELPVSSAGTVVGRHDQEPSGALVRADRLLETPHLRPVPVLAIL